MGGQEKGGQVMVYHSCEDVEDKHLSFDCPGYSDDRKKYDRKLQYRSSVSDYACACGWFSQSVFRVQYDWEVYSHY